MPELLGAGDPRFDEVVDYVREISADAGLNTRFTLDGDDVLVG